MIIKKKLRNKNDAIPCFLLTRHIYESNETPTHHLFESIYMWSWPGLCCCCFFVCFMSAVCCWRLPLMWAIQYQQEFWNGILSSSGSVSGNLIRRDTYTYNLQFVLIIHIGVLKWQSTINNLFTSGCFVFFVYRSSQCSQRFWLFKNKNET